MWEQVRAGGGSGYGEPGPPLRSPLCIHITCALALHQDAGMADGDVCNKYG